MLFLVEQFHGYACNTMRTKLFVFTNKVFGIHSIILQINYLVFTALFYK